MAVSAGLSPGLGALPTNYEYFTADGINQGLNANQSFFTLNDKLIRIYSGAMHYFRVPRPYWRDRLRKIRAAGMNTVETYVPWNLHEPEPGKYDFGNGGSEFEDFLHLEEFLNTAKEEDLFVILRTGPYICSEYNFGGFPSWLLREKTMGFRTTESTYISFVTRYFNVLLTLLTAFQFTQGGPVIAFQVENEYGNLEVDGGFQPEKEYLEILRQLFLSNGIKELLVTSDSPVSHGDKGNLPGVLLQTANFWANPTEQLDKLEELHPGKPLMVMEFWAGWFDFWGANHTTRTADDTRKYLGKILERNASVNVYMFLGGTNFAFNSGASLANILLDNSGFEAITTSYDYDSALGEDGKYTSKYYVFKEMITAANPVKTLNPDEPKYVEPLAYNAIDVKKAIKFADLIESNAPAVLSSENVVAMEKLDYNNGAGQSNGYIVYRKENIDLSPNSVLTIEGNVCDHVMVLVNGQLIAPKQLKYISDFEGFGYFMLKNSNVTLNVDAVVGATVDLIVENMGRPNGGQIYQYNQTFKGLWQGDVIINEEAIRGWKIVPLDLKKQWVNELKGWETIGEEKLTGPAMYRSVLTIEDEPRDTFLDIRGWGKGTVFVNGFALGRYAELGPQKTLYLPAPFLVKGDNEITFFEHFYIPQDKKVHFATDLEYENVY